jgi:hypothetical protein
MNVVTQLFRVTWCFPTCGRTLVDIDEIEMHLPHASSSPNP